ncbi:hypothetical protein AAD018_010590 [Aestuariibius insulae]|uniref:hypothetical protein n=1 Tax=Aestuariibius insulae TaxID=2058287 RepID=UPI00345E93A2
MADRHRSSDGTRDTDAYDTDAPAGSHSGREGGDLARNVGTQDELKQARQDNAGVTRVRKGDRANPMDSSNGSDTDNGDAN